MCFSCVFTLLHAFTYAHNTYQTPTLYRNKCQHHGELSWYCCMVLDIQYYTHISFLSYTNDTAQGFHFTALQQLTWSHSTGCCFLPCLKTSSVNCWDWTTAQQQVSRTWLESSSSTSTSIIVVVQWLWVFHTNQGAWNISVCDECRSVIALPHTHALGFIESRHTSLHRVKLHNGCFGLHNKHRLRWKYETDSTEQAPSAEFQRTAPQRGLAIPAFFFSGSGRGTKFVMMADLF